MAAAAILDVDGTLVDSNYQHTIAWDRALRAHGVSVPLWRIHRHVGVRVLPGAPELVAELRRRGVAVVLASSAKGEEVERYIDALGARDLAVWTTAADVEQTKPAPDLVEAALAEAGTSDAVMIGDTTWDIEAARRAGIPTIGVLTGGFGAAELRETGAIEVYESVMELCQRLDQSRLAG